MAIVACYHRHCVLSRVAPLLATTSLHKRPLFPTREFRGDTGHIAPFRNILPVDRRLIAALCPTHSCAEDLVGGTLVFSDLELTLPMVVFFANTVFAFRRRIQRINIFDVATHQFRPHCSKKGPLLRLQKEICLHLLRRAVDDDNEPPDPPGP